jgi:hypothetical protein
MRLTGSENDPLLDAMAEAGCIKIGGGIEAVTDQGRKQVGKGITTNRMQYTLARARSLGMAVRGYTMLGPWSGPDTRKEFQAFTDEGNVDELRVAHFITPPGSKIYEQYVRSGIVVNPDRSLHTTNQPVVENQYFSPQELIGLHRQISEDFWREGGPGDCNAKARAQVNSARAEWYRNFLLRDILANRLIAKLPTWLEQYP